jgi:hypothetical protein
MALDSQKYRDALAHLGDEQPVFVKPSAAFRAWLAKNRLPADVVDFLLKNAISKSLPFAGGAGGIWSLSDIMVLNDQEWSFLKGGFLAVGNAVNGDFIVVDLRDKRRRAGFVGHDELAGNYSEAAHLQDDPRAIFVPVDDSLDGFLSGVSDSLRHSLRSDPLGQHDYPIDYCDALTWRPKKRQKGRLA